MKKRVFIFLLGLFYTLPLGAQNTQHFAKQLLNLEKELKVFRNKIDEKERQIRTVLSKKSGQLYALKQKQRNSYNLTDAEKQNLSKEVKSLSVSIRKDKARMQEVMDILERKRKDIFSLKLSIDEWVAKVEATEIAVTERIDRVKREISTLISDIDKEFHTK